MKKMRTYDIIDYVKMKKRASLTELMEKFGVSSATIHRDVAELVASGHLERIRGGVAFFARAANPASANGGISYLDRATVNQTAKKRIAVKAVELVADGDILFLDSSTTTAAFADELIFKVCASVKRQRPDQASMSLKLECGGDTARGGKQHNALESEKRKRADAVVGQVAQRNYRPEPAAKHCTYPGHK